METYYTSDQVKITPGLRVLTNELEWGVIDPEQFGTGRSTKVGGEHFDGWFDVLYENGTKVLMNGERLRTTPLPRVRG